MVALVLFLKHLHIPPQVVASSTSQGQSRREPHACTFLRDVGLAWLVHVGNHFTVVGASCGRAQVHQPDVRIFAGAAAIQYSSRTHCTRDATQTDTWAS